MNSMLSQTCEKTVLLVEDDDVVRDAVTRLLVREGYLVLTAPSGHDAIGLLQTPATPIDLVMLDINLPDVSGTDLCARLRQLFPHLPVLVCSGINDPREAARLRRLGITRFFSKPIALDTLMDTLRTVLSRDDTNR